MRKHLSDVFFYKGQCDQAEGIERQTELQFIAEQTFRIIDRYEPVVMDKSSKRAFDGFVTDKSRSLKFCDLHLPSLTHAKTGDVKFKLASLMKRKFKRDNLDLYPWRGNLWQVVGIDVKIIKCLNIRVYFGAKA